MPVSSEPLPPLWCVTPRYLFTHFTYTQIVPPGTYESEHCPTYHTSARAIYTDGSKWDTNVGCAAVSEHIIFQTLSPFSSVCTVELSAILDFLGPWAWWKVFRWMVWKYSSVATQVICCLSVAWTSWYLSCNWSLLDPCSCWTLRKWTSWLLGENGTRLQCPYSSVVHLICSQWFRINSWQTGNLPGMLPPLP